MKKNEVAQSGYQNIKFYLTLALAKDEETGDFTAYYVQFPDACAQGRSKNEAISLLDEIFPYILDTKKDEFIKYHKDNNGTDIEYKDRQMTNVNA